MWSRKCSLFPERLVYSRWGVHDFTHSLYIHYILLNVSVLGLCLRITASSGSGLFAWISLTALSRTYFVIIWTQVIIQVIIILWTCGEKGHIIPKLLVFDNPHESQNQKTVLFKLAGFTGVGAVAGGGGGGGTPYIFHIHMCRQNAPLFDDFSLAGHLKNGHLLSICPTNSQASQIIIDQ